MPEDYYKVFDTRTPPKLPETNDSAQRNWHFFASLTIGFAVWYLHWRATASFNDDAIVFSTLVFVAECLTFIGTLLFYFDIWSENDTPQTPVSGLHSTSTSPILVDIFITTYDEPLNIVERSLNAAGKLFLPQNVELKIHLLDDGHRPEFGKLANRLKANYITRPSNIGFKAGNLRNALFQTQGDYVVICDADTILAPTFLENTLGYFSDRQVAWVQSPHWFYDLPKTPSLITKVAKNLGLNTYDKNWSAIKDPFMCDPSLFFDVIQRRRNRNGASFCCGAGSIHRREALFQSALEQKSKSLARKSKKIKTNLPTIPVMSSTPIEPFKFHVSEDIFTSIQLHSSTQKKWKSVYHPNIETKMLSPWSIEAWSIQRLKYAGGTFDIILNANPLFKPGMPWRTKLHYAATFWSYLSVLWTPILLGAPLYTLFTGIAPVSSFSLEFFIHLLPVLALNEIALLFGCKGHNISTGRTLSIACLPLHLKALSAVIRGKRPSFPATPKTPIVSDTMPFVWPHFAYLAIALSACLYGSYATLSGTQNYSVSLLIVNLFWVSWTISAVMRVIRTTKFSPLDAIALQSQESTV